MQQRLRSAEQYSLVVVGLVEREIERALAQWAASIYLVMNMLERRCSKRTL